MSDKKSLTDEEFKEACELGMNIDEYKKEKLKVKRRLETLISNNNSLTYEQFWGVGDEI